MAREPTIRSDYGCPVLDYCGDGNQALDPTTCAEAYSECPVYRIIRADRDYAKERLLETEPGLSSLDSRLAALDNDDDIDAFIERRMRRKGN